MLIVKKKPLNIITLEEVLERLKAKKGILLWKRGSNDLAILKNKALGQDCGWVSLYFNREEDNDCTFSRYNDCPEKVIERYLGTIYYFEDKVEALEFMLDFYKNNRRKGK